MNSKNPPKAHLELLPMPSLNKFIYAKVPPHLKKIINQAHLETAHMSRLLHIKKGNCSWMVWKRLMSFKKILWATILQVQTLTDPNQRANTVKNRDTTKISFDCWKNSENKLKSIKKFPGIKNSDTNNSNPNSNVNNQKNSNNKNSNRAEKKKPKTVYPLCETCGKTNHSTENCYYGANAANRPLPRQRRPERQN